MNRLLIEATKSTPLIDFNPEENTLIIKGESYPEDAASFYQEITEWLEKFLQEVDSSVEFNLEVIYLNTSSTKCFMNFFDMLEEASENGKDITINWYYDGENEIALECGEEFKEDLTIPFNIIQIEG